jgi:hypothetical protein
MNEITTRPLVLGTSTDHICCSNSLCIPTFFMMHSLSSKLFPPQRRGVCVPAACERAPAPSWFAVASRVTAD